MVFPVSRTSSPTLHGYPPRVLLPSKTRLMFESDFRNSKWCGCNEKVQNRGRRASTAATAVRVPCAGPLLLSSTICRNRSDLRRVYCRFSRNSSPFRCESHLICLVPHFPLSRSIWWQAQHILSWVSQFKAAGQCGGLLRMLCNQSQQQHGHQAFGPNAGSLLHGFCVFFRWLRPFLINAAKRHSLSFRHFKPIDRANETPKTNQGLEWNQNKT